jgi:hypothetical protein
LQDTPYLHGGYGIDVYEVAIHLGQLTGRKAAINLAPNSSAFACGSKLKLVGVRQNAR